MSANNRLHIYKTGNGKWAIKHQDVDTLYAYKDFQSDLFNTLEEAVATANNFMKEEEVEYGLDIDL